MKRLISKSMACAAAVTLIVGSSAAWSVRPPDNMVSGTVSAVGGNQIVVDGKSYSVKVEGPALRELQRVQVGQLVDLVLNGAPHASGSLVIAIHVRQDSR